MQTHQAFVSDIILMPTVSSGLNTAMVFLMMVAVLLCAAVFVLTAFLAVVVALGGHSSQCGHEFESYVENIPENRREARETHTGLADGLGSYYD